MKIEDTIARMASKSTRKGFNFDPDDDVRVPVFLCDERRRRRRTLLLPPWFQALLPPCAWLLAWLGLTSANWCLGVNACCCLFGAVLLQQNPRDVIRELEIVGSYLQLHVWCTYQISRQWQYFKEVADK